MLYWGIILFICIIVCVVSLKALNKSCWDSTFYLVSTLLTGVVAVIIALAMLLTTCEYRSFLASFEAQRTIITLVIPLVLLLRQLTRKMQMVSLL